MMTRQQYLLIKMAEECGEVAQRATKAATFGIDQVQKGQELNNRVRILGEFYDLLGVMRMLGLPTEANEEAVAKKIEKVESYMALSIELGTVEPQAHLVGVAVAEREHYLPLAQVNPEHPLAKRTDIAPVIKLRHDCNPYDSVNDCLACQASASQAVPHS